MIFKKILPLLALIIVNLVHGQQHQVVLDYINTYKELAIEEMRRTGVPASIKLAQGIHETQAGKSVLVLKSNNHFGIKCKSVWTGDKVYHDDDARGECFRSYPTSLDSYRDHSDFLKNSQRYSFLFNMDPTDYKAWAYGLKKAGYATNIKYSQILIRIIEQYDLQNYTLIAMNKATEGDAGFVSNSQSPVITTALMTDPPAPELRKEDYPAGAFMINNTRVVFAEGGTALLSIAQQHNIGLARLMEFNELKSDVLGKDQLVFLQRKRKTGANEFHVVKPGETLYDVCQAQGLRLESLVEYNHLQPYDQPAAGEKLYLRAAAPARPRVAENAVK